MLDIAPQKQAGTDLRQQIALLLLLPAKEKQKKYNDFL
jgi:hypothetical protein